jgi:hypothetical protein
MPLAFIGVDPNSAVGNSPTVWVDTDKQELLIQGWTATADEVARCYESAAPGHEEGVPAHEALVRIPARMVRMMREACDVLERADVR